MLTSNQILEKLEDIKTHNHSQLYESDIQLSQAVSLKRIADALEDLVNYEKNKNQVNKPIVFQSKEQELCRHEWVSTYNVENNKTISFCKNCGIKVKN